MLTKVKMHQMGFDFIDDTRLYEGFLRHVEPSGDSLFKEAYAYGIGMMLQFNQEFIQT